MTAPVPPGSSAAGVPGPAEDEPYTGPPVTAPYAAPPLVPGRPAARPPGGWPSEAAGPPPAGPVPWPMGPVPMATGPHSHPGGPAAWAPTGSGVPPVGAPPVGPPPFGPPPAVRWTPPPGTPPHDVPVPFLLAMRSRDWGWWRPLLGLLLFVVVYSVAALVVVLLALVTGAFPDPRFLDLVDPAVLLITNLSLIVAIPIVWLAWVVAHGMRPGWSASVLARMRPRLFRPYTLLALPTLGVGIALTLGLSLLVDGPDVTGPVPGYVWLVLVVLLTTPLQSAAEEYVFRGYLSQAIAGWTRQPRIGAIVAAVVTAFLFSAAHAPPDFLTFLDRFVFGLAASAVVWLTGGLEAAVVLHAVNNVLVFLLAGALGEGVATDAAPVGLLGLAVVAIDVLAMTAYVVLVARSGRRLKPESLTPSLDLRVPRRAPA